MIHHTDYTETFLQDSSRFESLSSDFTSCLHKQLVLKPAFHLTVDHVTNVTAFTQTHLFLAKLYWLTFRIILHSKSDLATPLLGGGSQRGRACTRERLHAYSVDDYLCNQAASQSPFLDHHNKPNHAE